MSERVNPDAVCAVRGERNFKRAFFGGIAFEALFLVVLLLAADLTNHTHPLILVATVGGCTVVVLGLVALGAHFTAAASPAWRRDEGRGAQPPTH